MTQIAEAFVRVRAIADTASFEKSTQNAVKGNKAVSRSLRETEQELGRFSRGAVIGTGALHGLGRAAVFASGTFIGGYGLVYGIESTISAATDATATLALTQQAVKTAGVAWADYGDHIEKATLAQVHATGFTNDQLLRTFDTLVRKTGDVNRALTLNALAANIARGRNISLESATNLVIRASLGLSGALRRLGIDAPKGASGLQLIQLLTEKYAGSAEAFAKSAAGSQAIFRAELQATEETIGTALLPTVTNYLTKASDWLAQTKNQEMIQRDVNSVVKTATSVIGDLSNAIGTLKDVISPAVDAVGGLKNAIELLVAVGVARKLTGIAAGFTAIGTEATAAEGAAGGAGVLGLGSALRGLPATVGTTILIEALINKKPIDDWLSSHHLGFATKGILPSLLGLIGGGSAAPAGPPQGLNTALKAKVAIDLSTGGGDFSTFGNPLSLAGFPINAVAPPGGTDAANQAAAAVPSRAALVTRDQATGTALAKAQAEGTKAQIIAAAKARLAFVKDTISFANKLIKERRGNTKQLQSTLQSLYGEEGSDQSIIDQISQRASDAAQARAKKAAADRKRAADAAQRAYEAGVRTDLLQLRTRVNQTKAGTDARKQADKHLTDALRDEVRDRRLSAEKRAQYRAALVAETNKESADAARLKAARAHEAELTAAALAEAKSRSAAAIKAFQEQAAKDAANYTAGRLQLLQNKVAAAQLITDPNKELTAEKKADAAIVAFYKRRVAALKAQKAGTLAVAQAQGDLLSAEQNLANLSKKTAGGFTLDQLFAEARSEFATYGSNIGSGPLSPQDARGSFAGTVKTHQTTVVQNFYGTRPTGQALADARAVARNSK